jgi:cytochrome c556
MRIKKPALIPFAAAALAFASLSVTRAAEDPAHERHEVMEEVQDSFKPLAAIAKKTAPFDAAVVQKSAETIAEKLKAASALFPAGSGGGKSRAKATIWSDGADFEKWMKESQAAAVALKSVKDEAAFGPAFQTLAVSCKNCHEKYRLPKQ